MGRLLIHRGGRPRTDAVARFWSNVAVAGPDDCWTWTGTTTSGYGKFKIGRQDVRASRFSLELHLGRPIAPGLWALHSCDNPPCVNPAHLSEGTPAQNSAEMVARGRSRKNVPNPR